MAKAKNAVTSNAKGATYQELVGTNLRPDLMAGLAEVVREMHRQCTSITVASQGPPSAPVSRIELSSQVILQKFNSPARLKHAQISNAALGSLAPERTSNPRPGEAFIRSSKATNEAFTKDATKIRCRPRVTHNSGTTKTAVRGY